jgi:hypothetical protein
MPTDDIPSTPTPQQTPPEQTPQRYDGPLPSGQSQPVPGRPLSAVLRRPSSRHDPSSNATTTCGPTDFGCYCRLLQIASERDSSKLMAPFS